jgi:hypothetical protein
MDSNGNLVGTTVIGGTFAAGTVFKLSPGSNGSWNFRLLYSFADGPNDGGILLNGVTFVNRGLFGTTLYGGANANGTIYEIKF